MESVAEPHVHIWNRAEYYKMASAGLFDGKHVELIEGRVIEMSPRGSLHATAVSLTVRALEAALGQGWFVRLQMPLDAGELSQPEPDVAVIQGSIRQFRDSHPQTAALIVEVAETSLIYDRTEKANLYATVGVQDYWILNLADGVLEVHRNPGPDSAAVFGVCYADVKALSNGDLISPLARPDVTIAVADLLP